MNVSWAFATGHVLFVGVACEHLGLFFFFLRFLNLFGVFGRTSFFFFWASVLSKGANAHTQHTYIGHRCTHMVVLVY